jgi:competence protein ComEC
MNVRLRVPPPLPCAIALALVVALGGLPARTRPGGARADDRQPDRIVGTIAGPVSISDRGRAALLVTRATTVWLWTDAPIEAGQRVEAVGRLRLPRGFCAPGSPDREVLAASRGAAWELAADELTVLDDEPGTIDRAWRWAARTQQALSRALPAGTPAGAALRGIVTGDRSRIPPVLDARWRVAGIYHVLSVSGLHLAVIAGLAFALLRRLVAASPLGARGRPARWAAPLALVLAVAYTLVTGAQLATLRALVVVALVLVAQMLERPVRLVDALGVAALAILAWMPADLFDPSFQLSFVAALTLAVRPTASPPTGSRARRALAWIARGLATSAWVGVTTAPITALHFQQVAIGGVVGNLVLTPVVELAALPLGLAGAALAVLGLPGAPLVTVATALVDVVDRATAMLAPLVPVGHIALASQTLMALLVALSLSLAMRPRRRRYVLGAWIALCAGWALGRTPPPAGALRVTFVDVGQGDAAIVELPGGDVWLVDAGGIASAADLTRAAAPGEAIERALATFGKSAVDLAVLSHPHPDHYLGLAALHVPIRELWTTAHVDVTAPPRSFGAIAAALEARGTRITRPVLGGLVTRDGVELMVWAPRLVAATGERAQLAPDPVRTVNDNSLVVAIRYAGRTVLFAGDLEAEGEEALVAAGMPEVDVVKVAHHGSPTSSSAALVSAAHARVAVISCGRGNTFGFPSPAVVARWRQAGASVRRTDLDGSVMVTIGPDGSLEVDHYAAASP